MVIWCGVALERIGQVNHELNDVLLLYQQMSLSYNIPGLERVAFGAFTIVIFSIQITSIMARKRKVSEDSDSEEFDEPSFQEEERNDSKRNRVSNAGDVFSRLCDSLLQRDVYKFFSSPVNTKKVTDYLRVIKTPMDLGTMKKKASKKQYANLAELQADFELIVNNAKLYNSPDTVYYKEADKLGIFGKKLIENEILNQANVPQKIDTPSVSAKSQEVFIINGRALKRERPD